MSKRISVAGKEYDSRSIITTAERLHLPNHPKVNAIVIPKLKDGKPIGKMVVIAKIPFGSVDFNPKEVQLVVESPRRIDAINAVTDKVKEMVMYRRK